MTMWNPFARKPSESARIKALEQRITELEDDVTSLTEWRVKLLAKLRGQSRQQLATAAGSGADGGAPAAADTSDVLALAPTNGAAKLTKDQVRALARARFGGG